MTGFVCAVDGVPIARTGSGRVIHTDELPQGVDPGHEIDPVHRDSFAAGQRDRHDVHLLAAEMLQHHASVHPASDCPFALRLAEALRSRR